MRFIAGVQAGELKRHPVDKIRAALISGSTAHCPQCDAPCEVSRERQIRRYRHVPRRRDTRPAGARTIAAGSTAGAAVCGIGRQVHVAPQGRLAAAVGEASEAAEVGRGKVGDGSRVNGAAWGAAGGKQGERYEEEAHGQQG